MSGEGVQVVLKVRGRSARDVSDFSPAPDLKECIFPPRRLLRVAGVYALEDTLLRRGLAAQDGVSELLSSFEPPDLGSLGASGALSWEEACAKRSVMVLLEEEEPNEGRAAARS